ncbi:hypothetical protein [Luteococcus sp. OSA5]|uniref:hypothetical protein n=1 Tax=Luteococcus sp. OSA5 TaxID=3401630 RepID=UPI003B42E90E
MDLEREIAVSHSQGEALPEQELAAQPPVLEATVAASASSPGMPDQGRAPAVSLESAEILENDAYVAQPRRGLLQHPVVRGLLMHVLLAMLVGALAGVVWNLVVDLPSYTVDADGRATTSERGLTQVFAADVVYSVLGAVVGLLIGLWAWRWFRRSGWLVVPLAIGSSLASAFLCWWVGVLLGPRNFASRIATAGDGDRVPIDFELHAHVAVLVWPFFATIPILLLSSLTAEEHARRRHNRRRRGRTIPATSQAPTTPVPPPPTD